MITMTMRGSGDGPWLTIHADSVDEMVSLMNRPPARLLDTLKGMTCPCGENHLGNGNDWDEDCFYCSGSFEHDAVQLACDQGHPPDLGGHDDSDEAQ